MSERPTSGGAQLYDPRLHAPVESAIDMAAITLQERMPRTAARLSAWLSGLSGGCPPASYFTHNRAFPTLLFPWWLDTALGGPDISFQSDLVRSSICGYYFVRLIDDLMDGAAPDAWGLLPALGHFHVEFEAPYQRLFPTTSPFWPAFGRQWSAMADATIVDATLDRIDAAQFHAISAAKVSGVRIPLLAVALHRGLDMIPPDWDALFVRVSAWHQFHNDFFDWQRDLAAHVQTWFLSEGHRRAAPGESIELWVVREGFEWGVDMLNAWMCEMRPLAQGLSSGALAYVDARAADFQATARDAREVMLALRRLADMVHA